MDKREKILVIRLGALGDLVLCFQAFAAIRRAHPKAEIALLTMPAFAGFALKMPWFDRVIVDHRPSALEIKSWATLLRSVRNFNPTRVYDLQGKFRQTILYALLGGPFGSEWSGAAPLCSHPRLWPPVPGMHYTDFLFAQLRRADVHPLTHVDLSWLDAPLDKFDLPSCYVVFIPGSAPTRLYKRWPATHYAELANRLRQKGVECIAIGTALDADAIAEIKKLTSNVRDLSGKTNLFEVAAIVRRSDFVVGNDTGPTHLAAAVGANTLTLFSEQVNAEWAAPKGPRAKYKQGRPISAIGVEEVDRFFNTKF